MPTIGDALCDSRSAAASIANSGTAFLEVKIRNARDLTIKSRMTVPALVSHVGKAESEFVAAHAPYFAEALLPALLNTFSRVTLVDPRFGQRLTMDFDLAFAVGEDAATLLGLVVIELKHTRSELGGRFVALTKSLGLHASGFSKYCVGTSLLRTEIKHNRFLPELRMVKRITEAHLGD